MAAPARPPPASNRPDTADILAAINDLGERMERRFEKVETEQRRQADILGKMDDHQRKQGEDIARIDGKLGELSARVPSIWTIAAMIVSLFGASFVLIRFASGH